MLYELCKNPLIKQGSDWIKSGAVEEQLTGQTEDPCPGSCHLPLLIASLNISEPRLVLLPSLTSQGSPDSTGDTISPATRGCFSHWEAWCSMGNVHTELPVLQAARC